MLPRERNRETEDDLIRAEEQFLVESSKKGFKSAATLVKPVNNSAKTSLETPNIVIGDIVEKASNFTIPFVFKAPTNPRSSFPVVTKLNNVTESNIAPWRTSVVHSSLAFNPQLNSPNLSKREQINLLKSQVSGENDVLLSKLDKDEIIKEKEQLIGRLSPSLLNFMANRKSLNAKTNVVDKQSHKFESDVTNEECLKESFPKLDLTEFPVLPNSDLINFDIPEPEKMAWMASIKSVSDISVSLQVVNSNSARFDLTGSLIVEDDFSVKQGLHHHGVDADKAGYTIEELLTLCRSQQLNQKVLALQILAKIVAKAKLGCFDSAFHQCLLDQLLDHQICSLIRFNFDENQLIVIQAAARLLAALLDQPIDEACLDRTFQNWNASYQVELNPELIISEDDEVEAWTDEQWCKRDVVKGLLRMDILVRMRYAFDVLNVPSAHFIADCIASLVRISRHSYWARKQIFDCPFLMSTLFSLFMPEKYFDQVRSILRYIVSSPMELSIPNKHACQVIVESYRLLYQLLSFKLCVSWVHDLYAVLDRHLHEVVAVRADVLESASFIWDQTAVCCTVIQRYSSLNQLIDADAKLVHAFFRTLVSVLGQVMQNAITEIIIYPDNVQASFFNLVSCGLNAVCTTASLVLCCQYFPDEVKCTVKNDLKSVVKVADLLNAKILTVDGIKQCSVLLDCINFKRSNLREPISLPSVRSTNYDCSSLFSTIRELSSFKWICALCNLIELATSKLQSYHVLDDYVQRVSKLSLVTIPESVRMNYFFCEEANALYCLTRILLNKSGCLLNVMSKSAFNLAFRLVIFLRKGFEAMALHLFDLLIEQRHFDESSKCWTEIPRIKVAFFGTCKSVELEVANSIYRLECSGDKDCATSLYQVYSEMTVATCCDSWFIDHNAELCCGIVWPLQPITSTVIAMKTLSYSNAKANIPDQQLEIIRCSLMWTCLIVEDKFEDCVVDVFGIEQLYWRLSEIIFLGGDVYLDECVNELLEQLVSALFGKTQLLKIIEAEPQDLFCSVSFVKFYDSVLVAFESETISQSLAQLIMLPMLVNKSCALSFWSEDRTVARSITFDASKCSDNFRAALGRKMVSDVEVMVKLAQNIVQDAVTDERNPVLHQFCKNQLKAFVKEPCSNDAVYIKERLKQFGKLDIIFS